MRTVTLRDGCRVHVRPVEPDDRATLRAAFERLSPESRYRRFFGPVQRLSESDLDFLTRIDHHDHEALVAVEPETCEGLGVARYVRTADDAAEPAVVVVDDWQGRGLATVLLDMLVERAHEEGVRRFDAYVLAGNQSAVQVLERLGTTTRRASGGELELRIDLPAEPGRTNRIGPLLRQFAAGTVQPARTLLEFVWPRRPGAPDDPRRNLVVVGTDGSGDAAAAVEAAAVLAAAWDAIVHVVGVHRLLLAEQQVVSEVVRATAQDLRERGLHVHEHLRRGDPALVLAAVAAEEDARLVVVGAGGRSKTARRMLGNVADSVAQRSPCDVLIVRPRT